MALCLFHDCMTFTFFLLGSGLCARVAVASANGLRNKNDLDRYYRAGSSSKSIVVCM